MALVVMIVFAGRPAQGEICEADFIWKDFDAIEESVVSE
jgi:hypothetical protein